MATVETSRSNDGIGDILDIIIRESNRGYHDTDGRENLIHRDSLEEENSQRKSKVAILAVSFVFTLIVVMSVILVFCFLSSPTQKKTTEQVNNSLTTNFTSVMDSGNSTKTRVEITTVLYLGSGSEKNTANSSILLKLLTTLAPVSAKN